MQPCGVTQSRDYFSESIVFFISIFPDKSGFSWQVHVKNIITILEQLARHANTCSKL